MSKVDDRESDFKDIDAQISVADEAERFIKDPSVFFDSLIERRAKIDEGIKLPWRSLDEKLSLREGEVIVIAGPSGHGKSMNTNHICHHAMVNGTRVGIASLELQAEDLLEQFCEFSAARARPEPEYVKRYLDWADGRLHIYNVTSTIAPYDAIRMCIRMAEMQCKLIVLDCLMMMNLSDDSRGNENRVERDFMATLNAIAKKYNVSIVLVHHIRKPDGKSENVVPNMHSLLGSSMITNMASTVIIFFMFMEQVQDRKMREPPTTLSNGKPYGRTARDAVLKVVKQRNNAWNGAIRLWQCDNHRAFIDDHSGWDVALPKYVGPPQGKRTRAPQRFPGDGFKPEVVESTVNG